MRRRVRRQRQRARRRHFLSVSSQASLSAPFLPARGARWRAARPRWRAPRPPKPRPPWAVGPAGPLPEGPPRRRVPNDPTCVRPRRGPPPAPQQFGRACSPSRSGARRGRADACGGCAPRATNLQAAAALPRSSQTQTSGGSCPTIHPLIYSQMLRRAGSGHDEELPGLRGANRPQRAQGPAGARVDLLPLRREPQQRFCECAGDCPSRSTNGGGSTPRAAGGESLKVSRIANEGARPQGTRKVPVGAQESIREGTPQCGSVAVPAHAGNVVGVEVVLQPAPCSQPPVRHQPDLPLATPDAPRTHADGCGGSATPEA